MYPTHTRYYHARFLCILNNVTIDLNSSILWLWRLFKKNNELYLADCMTAREIIALNRGVSLFTISIYVHFLSQLSLPHVCNRTNERSFFTSWFITHSMLRASTTTVCEGKMLMQSHLTCYTVYQCLPSLGFLLSLWRLWKYLCISPAYSLAAYSSSPVKVQKHKGSRTIKRGL